MNLRDIAHDPLALLETPPDGRHAPRTPAMLALSQQAALAPLDRYRRSFAIFCLSAKKLA
jgi:hypothetical protein